MDGYKLRKRTVRISKPGFWQQYVLVPAVPLLLGFAIGVVSDWRKNSDASDRLVLEYRTKIFTSTSDQFAPYILNWGRLINISTFEWKVQKLSPTELKNKESYVEDRNKAKNQLYAHLDSAALFFDEEVDKAIKDFKEFDAAQNVLTVDKLPSVQEWEKHKLKILLAMKSEIRK